MSYELRDRMGDAAMVAYKAPTVPREVLAYREPVDIGELLEGCLLYTSRCV